MNLSKIKLNAQKHSPEVFMVVGILGVIGGTIMACKASTKVKDVIEEKNNKIEEIKEKHSTLEEGESLEVSEKEEKKEITKVYVETGLKFVKLYGPAVVIGTLSIGSILSSNQIIKKRNVALTAAYKAVDTGFKEYRERVVKRFGKELDQELRFGVKQEKIETEYVDENGKKKKKKESVAVIDGLNASEYAKFFDASSCHYEKNAEYNLNFLVNAQSMANDKLRRQGYLFLNEVYDMLDIPRTKAGQVVGWVFDEEHPNGDNYIDFGIFNVNRPANRDFVNGLEPVILLDFNVDGNILDLMY